VEGLERGRSEREIERGKWNGGERGKKMGRIMIEK
jgi:hypothetical protein